MGPFSSIKHTEFSVKDDSKTRRDRESTKLPSYIKAKNGPNGKTLYIIKNVEYVTANGRLRRCNIEVLSNGSYQDAAKAALAAVNEMRTYSVMKTDSFSVKFGANGQAQIKRNGPNPSANQGVYKQAILSDKDKQDIENTYINNSNESQAQRLARISDNLAEKNHQVLVRLRNVPDTPEGGILNKVVRFVTRSYTKQELETKLTDEILEVEEVARRARAGAFNQKDLDKLENSELESRYTTWHKFKKQFEGMRTS